jgi:hypothetical protein
LFLQLGGVALAQSAPPSISIKTYRDELGLLHHAVDRSALRAILAWDPKDTPPETRRSNNIFEEAEPEGPRCAHHPKHLREPFPGERVDDSTPMMILHLWASWCEPCKEDLAMWRDLGPNLAKQHKGRIRVVHVALEADAEGMSRIASELGDRLPVKRLYFDCDERLAKDITQTLGRQPPLPITLWLDSERIVRQAMVGPLTSRRTEVIESTARLMALIDQLEDAAVQRSLHRTP